MNNSFKGNNVLILCKITKSELFKEQKKQLVK